MASGTTLRALAAFLSALACTPPPPTSSSPATETGDTSVSAESDEIGDSGLADGAYCRSLDPDWADRYTTETDQHLREIIEAHDLLGDPTLYVEDGRCLRRRLPDIADPLPQLGRDLFFSTALSGGEDTACATCHHPLLGGGDGISLPVGPAGSVHAVGADRLAGLTDPDDLRLGRNAPSVFNVALWDQALFWDGRLEAVSPEAGFGGSIGGISAPIPLPDPANLVEAQAYLPVHEQHEMAGDWGEDFETAEALWEALAARLRADPGWVERFSAACDSDPLPARFQAHCDSADTPEALVTFPAIAVALSEYQRSQIFVETPWSAYVQGDTDAISDSAKSGALIFYHSVADGGQDCQACHSGDFFTDEGFHAIGPPQLGPGQDGSGLDEGRAGVTGDPTDAYAFRTPTLLNLPATAPYFHAGSHPSLTKTVQHYRGVESSLSNYFGYPGQPLTMPPPWCRMAWLRDLPDCESLYSIEATNGGDIEAHLDVDFSQIEDFSGTFSTVDLEAFLRALVDPRTGDAEALSPWIAPESEVEVTDTSWQWGDWCDEMVFRPPDNDLRIKGIRWLALGAGPPGSTVNTRLSAVDLFGMEAWLVFGMAYTADTGLTQRATSAAVGVLVLLSAEQRALLLQGHLEQPTQVDIDAIGEVRQQVGDALQLLRSGETTLQDAGLEGLLQETARLEGEAVLALAGHFREVQRARDTDTLDEHREAMRAYLSGDLSGLPDGVFVEGASTLEVPAAIAGELAASGMLLDEALGKRILAYATFTAGPSCRYAFTPRQEYAERRAAYYSFSAWVEGFFFDLQTGHEDAFMVQEELGGLLAALEADSDGPDLEAALAATVAHRRAYDDARKAATSAMETFADPARADEDGEVLSAPVLEAFAGIAAAEHLLLEAELTWYLDFWAALSADQQQQVIDYILCLESPAVQEMREAGGFEALGGGSCLP